MDLDKIEKLVKIIENSSIQEFSIKEGNSKITLSRRGGQLSGQAAALSAEQSKGAGEEEGEDENYITSPIVGTFYSAPAPGEPAFVRVGDVVKAGDTVCILEAMKLMNEVQSEYDCEIEAVLVSNEQRVEYGQPLFKVKKVQN